VKATPLDLEPVARGKKTPKEQFKSPNKAGLSIKPSQVKQSTLSSRVKSKKGELMGKDSDLKHSAKPSSTVLNKTDKGRKTSHEKRSSLSSLIRSKKVKQHKKSSIVEEKSSKSLSASTKEMEQNIKSFEVNSPQSGNLNEDSSAGLPINKSTVDDDLDRRRSVNNLEILQPPSNRAHSTPAKSSTVRRSFSKLKNRPITKRKYYRDTQEVWKCKYCPHVCMLSEKRFHTVEHPAQIRKRLYLSDWKSAKDGNLLMKIGISHILNCAKELNHSTENHSHFEIMKLELQDKSSQRLSQDYDRAYEFIHKCRSSGGKVLVHCQQGVSRSASFVAMYLMYTENCSFDAAMAIMSSKRHIVQPNSGFIRQLRALEKKLAKEKGRGSRRGSRGMRSSRANTPGP